jgi:hypothetical protein
MDANEIVVYREQRDGVGVVFDLLRERIGQPSKTSRVRHSAQRGAVMMNDRARMLNAAADSLRNVVSIRDFMTAVQVGAEIAVGMLDDCRE